MMSRIFIWSDLHVDHPTNRSLVFSLSRQDYQQDVLVVSGDVTDCMERLRATFEHLRKIFAMVFFVPGNHELWIRRQPFACSVAKFAAVIDLCKQCDVATEPKKVKSQSGFRWIVPMFSWYRLPDEGDGSLYIAKETEDRRKVAWGDDHFCRWRLNLPPAEYFLELNHERVHRDYDAPVISFSHFLPRRELIFSSDALISRYAHGRSIIEAHPLDPQPFFNFSRVAGDMNLDEQIRRFGSMIHIYGHQHRNRDRVINGIRYVSHCLGSPYERSQAATDAFPAPLCIQ